MAANAGVRSCHFTLGAGVADTVTLTDSEIVGFDVILRSGTGPVWFTWAPGVAPAAATAAADEADVVVGTGTANARRVMFKGERELGQGGSLLLSVLSATADLVSVVGIYGD